MKNENESFQVKKIKQRVTGKDGKIDNWFQREVRKEMPNIVIAEWNEIKTHIFR